MISRASENKGFTIVELLIVVVVIAILAAITIVAYNGIKSRADASALSSTLKQATTWVGTEKAMNGGILPTNLDGLKKKENYTYDYKFINRSYCVAISDTNTKMSLHSGSITASSQYPGVCPYAHWTLASLTDNGFSGVTGNLIGSPALTTNQKGQSNSAYSLADGKYIDISNSQWGDIFAGADGFTVGAWVNMSSFGSEVIPVIGQRYADSMVFGIRSNGRLQLRMDDTSNGLQSDDAIPLGSWHYIAVSYTPSDNHNARYYIDGEPSGVVSTYDGSGITGQPNLYIGWQARKGSGADSPFVGTVSEVSVYDRPLNNDEIKGMYLTSK